MRFPWILLALGAVSSGCKKPVKIDDVVASCDKPLLPEEREGSRVCSDFYDEEVMRKACAQSPRGLPSNKPCDRTGAVAACKMPGEIVWHYTRFADAQEISKTMCSGKPMLLPDGGPFTPRPDSVVNPEKLALRMATDGAGAKEHVATVASLPKKLPALTGKVNMEALYAGSLLIHAEDLEDPEHPKALAHRLAEADVIGACVRIIAGRSTLLDDGYVIQQCSRSQVIAVLSVNVFSVERGRVAGELRAFRLDNAKYLGGFAFEAESAPTASELSKRYITVLTTRSQESAPGLNLYFRAPDRP